MGNKIVVELKNENALNLLYDLEKMDILHVVREDEPEKIKNSDRFRGILTKEQGKSLNDHIKLSREEWDRNTL
jgi:hypothetical protein